MYHPRIQRRDDDDGVDVTTVIIAMIVIGIIVVFIIIPILLCCYCSRKRRSDTRVITENSHVYFSHLRSREAETTREESSPRIGEALSNNESHRSLSSFERHRPLSSFERQRYLSNTERRHSLPSNERPEAIPLEDLPPPPYKERDDGGDPHISRPMSAYVPPRAEEDPETDWGRDVRSLIRS